MTGGGDAPPSRRDAAAARAPAPVSATRLLAFCDGVFAIAITLLVLDLTIPSGLSDSQVPGRLEDLLPQVQSFALSFVVIAAFWRTHHAIHAPLSRADERLLRLEFLMLACIVVVPFPTQLLGEYGGVPICVILYAGTVAATAASALAIWRYVSRHPELTDAPIDPEVDRARTRGLGIVVAVFVASIPVALVAATVAPYTWLAILPLNLVADRVLSPRRL